MDKTLAFMMVAVTLFSSLTLCAADDVRVTDLEVIPDEPYEDDSFEIYARATDDDGIDELRLYADGDLEDTEDCDGDETCSFYFDVYEFQSGDHTYKVKAYGLGADDDTDSETIEVYVRPLGSGSGGAPYISAYASPSNPSTGQYFTIYATASDVDNIYRIEVRHGGSVIGTQYCGYTSPCSRSVSVQPKYNPGVYTFEVRAYSEDDQVAVTTVSVTVGSSYYCGDRACNNGETCSSCPTDCGYCPSAYCGDRTCGSTESCSTCPTDCGTCQITPVHVVYTCDQRGGECCDNGGSNAISGAADCPSKCFSTCNPAPQPVTPQPQVTLPTPSGAAISADSSTILFGMTALTLLLVIYVASKVK